MWGVVIKAGDLWRQIVFTFMIPVEITNGMSVGAKWSRTDLWSLEVGDREESNKTELLEI